MTTINDAVESIANWCYTDSRIEVDRPTISEALQVDHETAGRYPTEKECEQLVCGDDDGEVPEELQELFPETHMAIGAYWE